MHLYEAGRIRTASGIVWAQAEKDMYHMCNGSDICKIRGSTALFNSRLKVQSGQLPASVSLTNWLLCPRNLLLLGKPFVPFNLLPSFIHYTVKDVSGRYRETATEGGCAKGTDGNKQRSEPQLPTSIRICRLEIPNAFPRNQCIKLDGNLSALPSRVPRFSGIGLLVIAHEAF